MDRRRMLQVGFGIGLVYQSFSVTARAKKPFDELFAEARRTPEEFEAVRSEREDFDPFNSKAAAPRVMPSERRVAKKAVDLLVFFEVTDEAKYKKRFTRPVWPKGQSGVTIGVGYDLGAVRPTWLADDWRGFLHQDAIDSLIPACQKKGAEAAELTVKLQQVVVPWPMAIGQFTKRLLPLYIGQTLMALPLASGLSDKSLGALVSLVYNRGADFTSPNETRTEMVGIKDALVSKDYESIPELIRRMKRIWKYEDFPGLHKRRDLEAALFEEGLARS